MADSLAAAIVSKERRDSANSRTTITVRPCLFPLISSKVFCGELLKFIIVAMLVHVA